MARQDHLPVLFNLFRQYGYDGVSLAQISAATGLGKASLYHHFPGGKAEMVTATLDYSQQWFEKNILQVLQQEGAVRERFEQMCSALNELYEAGEQPCLMAALVTGVPRDVFQARVKGRLLLWVRAIATALTSAGLAPDMAQQRGEDAVMTLQGALILSRGLEDSTPFRRAIAQLPAKLCEDIA